MNPEVFWSSTFCSASSAIFINLPLNIAEQLDPIAEKIITKLD